MGDRASLIAEYIDAMSDLVVRARQLGSEDFDNKLLWKDCPFDFSVMILRDAWLVGYSDSENKSHLRLAG